MRSGRSASGSTEDTPSRFYGSRRKCTTASGRLYAANLRSTAKDWTPSSCTTPTSRSSGGGAGAREKERQVTATPHASGNAETLTTAFSENAWTPSRLNSTPRPWEGGRQGTRTPAGIDLHYKPGERLQDRTDLYSERGSESESEGLDDFTLPLEGSSLHNSRRSGTDTNSPESNNHDWRLLFQNQQAMLLKVIQQQDDMKEQYTGIGKRLDAVESTVTGLATQRVESGHNSDEEQSNKLPSDLKVSFVCWLMKGVAMYPYLMPATN